MKNLTAKQILEWKEELSKQIKNRDFVKIFKNLDFLKKKTEIFPKNLGAFLATKFRKN